MVVELELSAEILMDCESREEETGSHRSSVLIVQYWEPDEAARGGGWLRLGFTSYFKE